ncbi:TPA: hypothetical protein U2C93_001451 [Streptococcus suis]|uniref:hypothetical protein n=1 Tax=Streptococcus suis TaxID=1307 RepID=UPI001146CC93|nr:hypothetical protein [Streptococcus suis]MCB2922209.1 hypothetical protein [Streptococcus suis]MCB2932065.1 hypothetical protein [Streptococcus suis]MCB2941244.1 hypothetical protein [Streptococcus suis]MCB2941691.1 hypothetical protein [Streptococcus suis]MCB2945763.1 hypothetical protein [Streptococcus suis]
MKFLKIFAIGIGVILIFLLGFGFGQMGKSATPAKEQTEKQVTSDSKEKDVVLTQDFVTEFLMVYYTKKDLSENRNRYKEYMTDTMYNQVVHLEDQPTNQTYKGFVVDFEYKDSTVYLDNQKNTAIVKVNYTNTLLAKKNDYSQARTESNTATLRLNFTRVGDGFLLNYMESIILVDAENSKQYADVNIATPSEDQDAEGEILTEATEPSQDTAISTEEGE